MRLIDADRLIERLRNAAAFYGHETAGDFDTGRALGLNEARQKVAEQPIIEVEPVKRGQWIHHAGMNSKCSCCGRYFPVAEFEQRPFDVNFCIHCGARMRGDEK